MSKRWENVHLISTLYDFISSIQYRWLFFCTVKVSRVQCYFVPYFIYFAFRKIVEILLNPHIYITYSIHTQSRSSPYAEYASCEGLPKHQGAPLPLKDEFWILNFACGYENMNDHLFKMRCAVTSSDPRLLGSLRRTGWGLKWKNGCNAVVCVLLRLESQSRKALISSAAPYAFN